MMLRKPPTTGGDVGNISGDVSNISGGLGNINGGLSNISGDVSNIILRALNLFSWSYLHGHFQVAI